MTLIVKSNIKKVVKELDKENSVSSVAEEVGMALERKVEDILKDVNKGKIVIPNFIKEFKIKFKSNIFIFYFFNNQFYPLVIIFYLDK